MYKMYFAGSALHNEHDGSRWNQVMREMFVTRDTDNPKLWIIYFHLDGTIYCPVDGGFRTKTDAMTRCLFMQAASNL